jgi:hypothetical protein
MHAISDGELLLIWEAAQAAPPVFRPAEVLRAAGEDAAPERLPIGVRDRRLLALRQRWFGDAFEALADCPRCGAAAELTFEGRAIDAMVEVPAIDSHDARFRLPDTTDLAAIADAPDEDEARARLVARCIVDGAADHDEIIRAMSAADPAADLTVAVTCPECGSSWEALFDPATFVLRELDAAAVRIFREIDALAVAYGWSEREILSLSRARRRTYLRMVTA